MAYTYEIRGVELSMKDMERIAYFYNAALFAENHITYIDPELSEDDALEIGKKITDDLIYAYDACEAECDYNSYVEEYKKNNKT